MSCNGCRVLRKGCSYSCVLRPTLQWIVSQQAQGHATLFVAKFFGRSDLMTFLSAVPDHCEPALFQSLLSEACGRFINPVSGAVGLLSCGNWHLCKQAVDTVLLGGSLRPLPESFAAPMSARPAYNSPVHGQDGRKWPKRWSICHGILQLRIVFICCRVGKWRSKSFGPLCLITSLSYLLYCSEYSCGTS